MKWTYYVLRDVIGTADDTWIFDITSPTKYHGGLWSLYSDVSSVATQVQPSCIYSVMSISSLEEKQTLTKSYITFFFYYCFNFQACGGMYAEVFIPIDWWGHLISSFLVYKREHSIDWKEISQVIDKKWMDAIIFYWSMGGGGHLLFISIGVFWQDICNIRSFSILPEIV